MWETWVQSPGWEDPLEKGMAIHSGILAWRMPWTVYSTGSQRIVHDWMTCTVLHIYIYIYIHTHTRIHIFFFIFFSIMVYHRILNRVPCCLSIIMLCKINYRRMGIFMMLNLSKQVHGTFLFKFTSVTSKNHLISLCRFCMFFLLSLLLNALSVLFL